MILNLKNDNITDFLSAVEDGELEELTVNELNSLTRLELFSSFNKIARKVKIGGILNVRYSDAYYVANRFVTGLISIEEYDTVTRMSKSKLLNSEIWNMISSLGFRIIEKQINPSLVVAIRK